MPLVVKHQIQLKILKSKLLQQYCPHDILFQPLVEIDHRPLINNNYKAQPKAVYKYLNKLLSFSLLLVLLISNQCYVVQTGSV